MVGRDAHRHEGYGSAKDRLAGWPLRALCDHAANRRWQGWTKCEFRTAGTLTDGTGMATAASDPLAIPISGLRAQPLGRCCQADGGSSSS